MTRIERIDADLFGFIRDDPHYLCRQCSIESVFDTNTNF
jgi:hypothetical protein